MSGIVLYIKALLSILYIESEASDIALYLYARWRVWGVLSSATDWEISRVDSSGNLSTARWLPCYIFFVTQLSTATRLDRRLFVRFLFLSYRIGVVYIHLYQTVTAGLETNTSLIKILVSHFSPQSLGLAARQWLHRATLNSRGLALGLFLDKMAEL